MRWSMKDLKQCEECPVTTTSRSEAIARASARSGLSRAYRAFYVIKKGAVVAVEVIEVNEHDY